MDKTTNQELFKQALVEGVNKRLDREIAAYDEDITYSRRHIKNMTRIVNGKTPRKPLSPKMIAILVAAAILLASCAIIYRNEIREFFTDLSEYFVKIKFEDGENFSQSIEDIYELTYVPDGYALEKQEINRMRVEYLFVNTYDDRIKFIQRPLDDASFSVDIEHGDYDVINIGEYKIYYHQTDSINYYLWNDGKYAMQLYVSNELPEKIIMLMINGINTK